LDPPFSKPSAQTNPIYVAVVREGTFAIFIGESGIVKITPPFPASDTNDSPLILIAMILAVILEPHSNLNGV